MAEFTPGPWTYEYAQPDETMTNLIVSYVDVDVGEDGRPGNFGGSLLEGFLVLDDATNEANARLIAAAPALLTACEAALPQLRGVLVIQRVQQAIATARGEAQR